VLQLAIGVYDLGGGLLEGQGPREALRGETGGVESRWVVHVLHFNY
jgi:hypothetical protein